MCESYNCSYCEIKKMHSSNSGDSVKQNISLLEGSVRESLHGSVTSQKYNIWIKWMKKIIWKEYLFQILHLKNIYVYQIDRTNVKYFLQKLVHLSKNQHLIIL